ncbi:MAG: tRNA dimethylallyltransferase [Anaerolineales bacterium]|nr:tRNA dimethylallyltransferase [Anaerolineales bacterium]
MHWYTNMTSKPLIVIVGPTAVGKTSAAIRLAEDFAGEIVSADSRQVYRGMDIGTAKPTAEGLARAPHHLIDIVDPDEEYHVAQFQRAAYTAIDDIHARGKVPFLVGGTGQYVCAVVEGWQIPPVPPQPDFRARLQAEAEEHGPEPLHRWLAEVDPEAAERIHPNNVRRVIRALEVYEVTRRPISDWQGKEPPPYRILQIGLTMEREVLYQRTDERVGRMMAEGLVDEVRSLLAAGYTFELPAMSSLGYGEFEAYFAGEASLDEVVQDIKHETHRFVRQQYNWFSADDSDIHWFDVTQDSDDDIRALVADFLGKR